MIIYNKSKEYKIYKDTSIKSVKAIGPKLSEQNKEFLKLLNLKVKKNV